MNPNPGWLLDFYDGLAAMETETEKGGKEDRRNEREFSQDGGTEAERDDGEDQVKWVREDWMGGGLSGEV